MKFVFEKFAAVPKANVGSMGLEDKYGYIYPADYPNQRITVTSWLFASCACAGLENMDNICNWDWDDVDGFLAFLRAWESPHGWKPKKFYFLVKVLSSYEAPFMTELKKRARLCDEFENHAHRSNGKLGLYTLEVWEK